MPVPRITDNQLKSYRTYKDLIVYQKALECTILLIKYYSNKKLNWIEKDLVGQLVRAVSSIGANLAEGYGRMHKQDYRRFISISRGSSFEVDHWINLLLEIRPIDITFLKKTGSKNLEIMKMLSSMMKLLQKS